MSGETANFHARYLYRDYLQVAECDLTGETLVVVRSYILSLIHIWRLEFVRVCRKFSVSSGRCAWPLEKEAGSETIWSAEKNDTLESLAVNAVSYTHLDVYKRQPWRSRPSSILWKK